MPVLLNAFNAKILPSMVVYRCHGTITLSLCLMKHDMMLIDNFSVATLFLPLVYFNYFCIYNSFLAVVMPSTYLIYSIKTSSKSQ